MELEVSNLLKIVYKPREAFEGMYGSVSAKEGLFAWTFSAIFGLIIFSVISGLLKINTIPLDFGVGGKLTPIGVTFGFIKTTVSLILIAWISSKLANKLGGNGNFNETLGMLGYSKVIRIIEAITSGVVVLAIYIRTIQLANVIGAGATPANVWEAFFRSIFVGTLIMESIFIVWELWIQGTAISVEHKLSFLKSISCLIISMLIVLTIWVGSSAILTII